MAGLPWLVNLVFKSNCENSQNHRESQQGSGWKGTAGGPLVQSPVVSFQETAPVPSAFPHEGDSLSPSPPASQPLLGPLQELCIPPALRNPEPDTAFISVFQQIKLTPLLSHPLTIPPPPLPPVLMPGVIFAQVQDPAFLNFRKYCSAHHLRLSRPLRRAAQHSQFCIINELAEGTVCPESLNNLDPVSNLGDTTNYRTLHHWSHPLRPALQPVLSAPHCSLCLFSAEAKKPSRRMCHAGFDPKTTSVCFQLLWHKGNNIWDRK